MSPVCKKCRNYVMDFPCPHCGAQQALTDREANEIKPIIPLDLQETFKEPPPPVKGQETSLSPSFRSSEPQEIPKPPPQSSITYTPPPPSKPPPIKPSFSSPPPTASQSIPPKPQPPVMPKQSPPSSMEQEIEQIPPLTPPKLSITTIKNESGITVPIGDIDKQFKSIEDHLKKINSHQKKVEKKFSEVDKKIKKIEKYLKIVVETDKKLEKVYKDISKQFKD